MTKKETRYYEDNKYINFENVEKTLWSDKYEEHKDFLKGIEKDINSFFGDKFGILKETFIDIENTEFVITHKLTCEDLVYYEEDIFSNGMMKSILNDSWVLAEELGKEVSQTHKGKGLSYCSGYKFDKC